MVTHLPSLPSTQSWMWSMAALAAEAAEDRPRASMIAAPRLPTVGMTVSAFHAASLIFSFSDSPLARSEEHTSELKSLMRLSYAVFCLEKNTQHTPSKDTIHK